MKCVYVSHFGEEVTEERHAGRFQNRQVQCFAVQVKIVLFTHQFGEFTKRSENKRKRLLVIFLRIAE